MVVLIIFPVILQTVINLIMLSIGGQGWINQPDYWSKYSLARMDQTADATKSPTLWNSVGRLSTLLDSTVPRMG